MFTSIWSFHNFLKMKLYNNVLYMWKVVRWSVCNNIRSSNHNSLWNRYTWYILHLCLFHNALSFSSVTCSSYFHFGWFKVFAWTIVASQTNTANWLFIYSPSPSTTDYPITIITNELNDCQQEASLYIVVIIWKMKQAVSLLQQQMCWICVDRNGLLRSLMCMSLRCTLFV